MHHKEITLRILKIRIIFNENHYEFCIPISNSFKYENIGYICRGYLVAKEGTYKFFDNFRIINIDNLILGTRRIAW